MSTSPREGGSGRPPEPRAAGEPVVMSERSERKTLYAEFTVTPGREPRVAQMMRELAEHVRREPGNVVFEPYVEQRNPNRYFVFEVYRDEAAFQAHITADYGARFNAELGGLIEGDASELTFLRPL